MHSSSGTILVWSEQQAALLRRLGAGEQVNDRIDWENVVEEIESVGRESCTQLNRCLHQKQAVDPEHPQRCRKSPKTQHTSYVLRLLTEISPC